MIGPFGRKSDCCYLFKISNVSTGFVILALTLPPPPPVEVVVKPTMVGTNHEIKFECVMAEAYTHNTSAAIGDIIFDAEWYITKSGRRKLVHSETTDGDIILTQSQLLPNFQGRNFNVRTQLMQGLESERPKPGLRCF